MKHKWTLGATCLFLCSLGGCSPSNSSQENKAIASSTASTSPTSKKDTKHFVRSCEHVPRGLSSPCGKFSFDYPDDWKLFVDEDNIGQVRISDDSRGTEFPDSEDFVDSIYIRDDEALKTMEDAKANAQINLIESSRGDDAGKYKAKSGEVRVGSYNGYQITLEFPKLKTYRMIFLPQSGGGLEIVINDAIAAPEMKGVDDPTKMGRYSLILNSLKIGSE
jgi:hypothetical protein